MTPLESAIRVRDAALRDLARADAADRGSRWITNPDEMRALSQRAAAADAEVERITLAACEKSPTGWHEWANNEKCCHCGKDVP